MIWEKGGLLSHFTQSKIAGSICTSNILLNFYIPHVVLTQSGSSYILNRIHRCIFSEAAEIPQDMEKSTTCQSQMNQIQYSDIHFYCLMATAPDKRNDTVMLISFPGFSPTRPIERERESLSRSMGRVGENPRNEVAVTLET